MVLSQAELALLLPDDDDIRSTTSTAITPATLTERDSNNNVDSFLVPWPGSTYIIRCINSGQVITLLNGDVILAQPDSPGCSHWACADHNGWLTFRNLVSGGFLGPSGFVFLKCFENLNEGGNFCVRMRPQGGCVMLLHFLSQLHVVKIRVAKGEDFKRLTISWGEVTEEAAWEFIRV